MSTRYNTGTPRVTEWKGKWRRTILEKRISEVEFQRCRETLSEHLAQRYRGAGLGEPRPQCYVRGDNLGEKTQVVHVVDAHIVDVDFLRYIQEFLAANWPNWRVIVPTDGTDENTIAVYSDVVRVNAAAERDLAAFCDSIKPLIAQRMRRVREWFGLPNGALGLSD